MTSAAPMPPVRKRLGELGWRVAAVTAAVAILFAIATHWSRWEGRAGWQTTDDAYLQADTTPIAAKVAGYVSAVFVEDFERVHPSQALVQIVDDDYRANVDQAQAAVAAAQAQADGYNAQLKLQQANIQAANAVVTATTADLDQNGRDLARQQRLLATGSSSAEASEKLQTTRAQLLAQLTQNRAQADAATRQIAVLAAQEAQARANVSTQNAALHLARINLGYTRITAPQAGVLGVRQVRVGQFVPVGGQVTTLTPLPHVWVIANFKETQLTHMAAGQAAWVSVDAYPGVPLHGHVIAFSPGSGAQFSLLPPDNATGNFTKVVQRVAVKISIDDAGALTDRLRPGLSVVANVDSVAKVRP